ncbi:MAG: type II toxin-antitoxin system RelE family toxin [Actinomycetota bacterium]
MPECRVTFTRSARRELEDLDRKLGQRIIAHRDVGGRAPSIGSTQAARRKCFWRLRVGDYRVIYSVNDAANWSTLSPFGIGLMLPVACSNSRLEPTAPLRVAAAQRQGRWADMTALPGIEGRTL